MGAVQDASTTRRPPRAEPGHRRPVTVLLLVGLAGVVWLLSPQAFPASGGTAAAWTEPQAADTQVLHDSGAYPGREVRVLLVRPRVTSGPADAVRLLVCDSATVGMTTGPVPSTCDPLGERVVLRPAEVDAGDQLVMAVDPVAGATVVVDGFDVLYRDGVRLGYQHVGGRHTVPFAPAG